jgi:drug/metabolite transporter (DMT)-like permease
VGGERMIAIGLGFLGVVIATRPGAGAFQPIVLLAVAGVVCNAGYVLATRKLAGADSAHTTLAWTQVAGLVFLTPILPWAWKQPESAGTWAVMAVMGVFAATSHGMLIVAHRYAPASTLTPFTYTQLIWMIMSGVVVFGDWPTAATLIGASLVVACGAYLATKERRGKLAATTTAI